MPFKVILISDGKGGFIDFIDGCNEDLGTLSDAELQIAERLDAGSDASVVFDFMETS
jgi:hypothetical protein